MGSFTSRHASGSAAESRTHVEVSRPKDVLDPSRTYSLPELIDFALTQGVLGHLRRDLAVAFAVGKIAGPAQQVIGHSRSPTAAAGDLARRFVADLGPEFVRVAADAEPERDVPLPSRRRSLVR